MTTNDESLGLGLLFEPKEKKEEGKLGSWRLLTWNTFHSLMLTSALTLQLSTQLVRCSMWGCSQNAQRVEQPVEFRPARAPLSKATVHSSLKDTNYTAACSQQQWNQLHIVAYQAARFGWLLVNCQKINNVLNNKKEKMWCLWSLKWKDKMLPL